MRALTWHGKHDVRVDTVDDPEILNPRDAIIKITSTAICGSDLHLLSVLGPFLDKGDVLGHETMGIVDSNIARARISSLKAHKSSIEPPPRQTISTSALACEQAVRMARASSCAAPGPCTAAGYRITRRAGQRRRSASSVAAV